MFAEFARGYYLRPYWVVSNEGPGIINQREYQFVKDTVYEDDVPVVMKLGTTHFQVVGDADVPSQVLYAPSEAVDGAGITREPDKAPVLLAKAKHAERILGYQQHQFAESHDFSVAAWFDEQNSGNSMP